MAEQCLKTAWDRIRFPSHLFHYIIHSNSHIRRYKEMCRQTKQGWNNTSCKCSFQSLCWVSFKIFQYIFLSVCLSFFLSFLIVLFYLAVSRGKLLVNLQTTGRTPWTGDRPDARPLPTQDNTIQRNADTHLCPEQDSNLRSQHSSDRRQYLPQTARLLRPAKRVTTAVISKACRSLYDWGQRIITALISKSNISQVLAKLIDLLILGLINDCHRCYTTLKEVDIYSLMTNR
jgi:hypothetical protein